MSKKVSATKLVALPKSSKSKVILRVLLIVALVLIVHDPIGSAAAVQHVGTAVDTFLNSAGGGPR